MLEILRVLRNPADRCCHHLKSRGDQVVDIDHMIEHGITDTFQPAGSLFRHGGDGSGPSFLRGGRGGSPSKYIFQGITLGKRILDNLVPFFL